jgi:ABC-type nitrate/sulfonate/bicarbonate transport system substrate-binding protein
MAEPKRTEIKIIYRSNHSQLSLISLMKHGGIWDKLGIDVTRLELKRRAVDAEQELIDGKCDLIFGCHITPHWRVANGVPMVCIAQAVNVAEDMLVSAKPVGNLSELKNKRLADVKFCDDEGHLSSHPRGTHELYLRDAGITSDMTDFQPIPREGEGVKMILDGQADATIVSGTSELECKRLGLHTKMLPTFPMVNSITLTTLFPNVQANPDLYLRMTKALAMAIAMARNQKDKTLEILGGQVGERLGIKDDAHLESFYQRMLRTFEPRLYPKMESLYNAYRIAELVYPELKQKGNPIKLWDLHFVRQIEAEGFFDELYQ